MENKSIHITRIVLGLFGIVGFVGCLAIASGWWLGSTSQLITFRSHDVDFPQIFDWIFNIMMLSGFAYYLGVLVLLIVRKKDDRRLFYVLLALSISVSLIPSVWSHSISWAINSIGVKELIKPVVMISMPLSACIFCFLNEILKSDASHNSRQSM
ncbi:MAG: hypothetical protein J5848_06135 [Bacteroidales bacterium]|nr:hypothetical protein [Bacteroidales bacterium]